MDSLLDILGTLIAFSAVMLVLSLVVTALVQATQSTLRLRGRNLYRGITALLEQAKVATNATEAAKLADEVCRSGKLVQFEQKLLPVKLPAWFAGVARSRIEKEELPELVKAAKSGVKDEALEEIEQLFPRLEKSLEKRFQFIMRIAALMWAVCVAIIFQVSAPGLLHDLSTDPELRAEYLKATEGLLDETGEALRRYSEYEDVSAAALERLQEEYPDLKTKLVEASGIGDTRQDLLDEIDLVLEDDPGLRAAVRGRYGEILDELYREQNRNALEELDRATRRLARFDIRPWGRGRAFYVAESGLQWGNLVGVLVTAVFLTFGAPFWYEQLKNLAKLRDALKPQSGNKETDQ